MKNKLILILSLMLILLWMLISFNSCAGTKPPDKKPLLVTFYKDGSPLEIRGEADSLILQGNVFYFVFYPDSDVVNGREKIEFWLGGHND